jgi:hypothetical protein
MPELGQPEKLKGGEHESGNPDAPVYAYVVLVRQLVDVAVLLFIYST